MGFINGSGNLTGVSPTNPLPVTPGSGAVFNENLTLIAGNPVDSGAGASSSGTLRVILSSDSPLAPGAATSSLQTSGNTLLGTIIVDLTNGSQITQITGTVPLPVGAATSALQTAGNSLLTTIASNQTNGTQVTAVNSLPAITGTVTANQGTAGAAAWPVSLASIPIATGAATAALQSSTQGTVAPGTAAIASTLTGGVFNSTLPTLTNGQGSAFQSDASGRQIVTDAAMNDLVVTGAAAQTAVVNNILTSASGTAATTVDNYRSASVQVVSTGTGGTFIFEGSNDNVNFQSIPVYNQLILTGTPITAAITATASQNIYIFPTTFNFVRLRIASTITGGSIQAFSRMSPIAWVNPVLQVAQNTAANLLTTATIGSGTVTTVSSVTSSQTAIPGIVADVASAAIITTTTTAAVTPTFGSSYTVNIPVTVVSGSTPTLSVAIQESADTGTNWYTVYTFPTIIATGSYNSPTLTLTGNRIRYVQTVTGSTPSFTRAINRLQSSQQTNLVPSGTIYTDRSGSTSATPSTSTLLAAANQTRRYMIIQNLSSTATIYINFTSAAAATGSLALGPLGSYVMESSSITTEAINVFSTTASIAYAAKEG